MVWFVLGEKYLYSPVSMFLKINPSEILSLNAVVCCS